MHHLSKPMTSFFASLLEEEDTQLTVGDVLRWVVVLLRSVTHHVRARIPPWATEAAQVRHAHAQHVNPYTGSRRHTVPRRGSQLPHTASPLPASRETTYHAIGTSLLLGFWSPDERA